MVEYGLQHPKKHQKLSIKKWLYLRYVYHHSIEEIGRGIPLIYQTFRIIILLGATSCAEQPHELIICSTRVIQSPKHPKLAVEHFALPCIFIISSRLFHSPLSFAKETMANATAMLEMQRVKLHFKSLGNLQIGSKVKNSTVKDNNENDENRTKTTTKWVSPPVAFAPGKMILPKWQISQ